MTNNDLASIESGNYDEQHTLQSLVPVVLINKHKVWRLGQPEDGKEECDVVHDQEIRSLFLSAPTPMLGGAKE